MGEGQRRAHMYVTDHGHHVIVMIDDTAGLACIIPDTVHIYRCIVFCSSSDTTYSCMRALTGGT